MYFYPTKLVGSTVRYSNPKRDITRCCALMNYDKLKDFTVFTDNYFSLCIANRVNNLNNAIAWNNAKTICATLIGNIFSLDGKLIKSIKYNSNTNLIRSLITAYEKYGSLIADKINGVFVLVFYNKVENEITIINDKFGYQPFFYYHDHSNFIFGSEVKSITCHDIVKNEINWSAWADNLYLSSINGNKTLFKNIYTIPPATVLTHKNNSIKLENYWDINMIQPKNYTDFNSAIDETVRLLKQSIKRQTTNLTTMELMLSGGHDSRCIAALLNKNKIKINSYTSQKEFGTRGDEVIAKKVAKKLNFSNTFINLPDDMYVKYFYKYFMMVEGMTDEHFWMMPLIDNLDSQNPVFDGLGGDILFGKSYIHQAEIDEFLKTKNTSKLITAIINRRKNRKSLIDDIIEKTFIPEIARTLRKNIYNSLDDALNNILNDDNKITFYLFNNKIRRGVALAPLRLISSKKDYCLPFLDNDLVKFVLSIRQQDKVKHNFYNKIINKINPSLSKIPYEYENHPSISIPERINYPYRNRTTTKYIENLFKNYDLAKGLQKSNFSLVYPNSKFVQFHLWYNIIYKQY